MATLAQPSESSRDAGSGHVILCGLGRVGSEILRLLGRLGETVTVVTLPKDGSQTAPDLGERVRVVHGDACDEAMLGRAGIAQAKALIAATDNDRVNVTIALHARKVAPSVPVVVRLFDEELGARLHAAVGIRSGHSASALAAPAFVAAARGDRVAAAFELAGEHWFVEERPIASDSAWAGRSVADVAAAGAVVLAVERGGVFSAEPARDDVLAAGDRLTLLVRCEDARGAGTGPLRRLATRVRALRAFWKSTPRGLRVACYGLLAVVLASVAVFHFALGLSPLDAYYFAVTTLTTTGYGDINLQSAPALVKVYGTIVMVSGGALFAVLFSMMTDLLLRTRFADVLAQGASHYRGHVIVAGLGNTGFRILRQLAGLGEDVVAIENRPEARFLGPARSLAPVVVGDAAARETLARAGLAGAKTVLAVTDDDLTNLSIALACKQVRPDCRVVARVFDGLLAGRTQQLLGIDAVISVLEAVAPTFVGSALAPEVVRGLALRDRLLLLALRTTDEAGEQEADARTLLVQGSDGTYRPPSAAPRPGARALVARWIALGN